MVCTNLGINLINQNIFDGKCLKIKVYSNQYNKNLNKQEN